MTLRLLLVCLVLAGCAHPRVTLTPAQARHKACLGFAGATDREYLVAVNQYAGDFVGANILRHCAEDR